MAHPPKLIFSLLAVLVIHGVYAHPLQPPRWTLMTDKIEDATLSSSNPILQTPAPIETDMPVAVPTEEPTLVQDRPGIELKNDDDDHCTPTISKQCSFVDYFNNARESLRWKVADNYANGDLFDVWWSKQNAVINTSAGLASLVLNREGSPYLGKHYTSGHFLSHNWYGYGCYEARIKPSAQSGLVSAFFAYAGTWDKPPTGSGRHNEIDVEFVTKPDQKKVSLQANYFTAGKGGYEHLIPLDFDPVDGFHNYAFKWTSEGVYWYVDGEEKYYATKNTPKESDTTLRIMMNMWSVTHKASHWAGSFRYKTRMEVAFDAVRFTRGEKCRIQGF